ncbi:MAG: hypothetical protein OQK57_00755 [Ignavibacteriaceae bacterium]|jgi:hypothetical protein|nr:hypothetical protein [Ignavibacteriaceae bacterium]
MEDLVPTEFYLGQNFPDPFKNKTIIKYCLPEEIRIRLEIFDSQKQKIKTLVDEIKEPGTYKVEFCAKGFREGIYLYSLTAGSIIITKRMLILK